MPSTSEGQSSGDPGGYVYRDRDPPPSWNGSTPEVSFKTWLRDLELWEATTDIPKEKRAIKLVQALTGPAREAVSSLTLAELQHADGYKTVMKVLNDNFKPYVETALPRAMEGVFYGQARGAKESIPDYLVRASHALAELKAEGVDLPAKAAGYLLFRQANLDKELESRVVTWLAGDYTKDVVIANLRRLDRINSSSSGSKAMLWTETEEGEGQEVYYENHEHYGEPEFYLEAEDEEDENYVYLEDGELDAVYEEGDVMEALASYQHVRQQLKEQQKGRQYYQPNLGKKGGKKLFNKDGKNTGKQSSKSFGKGGSAWKGSPTSRRVHIEQLKLRTRCRACGEVGHWSKECRHRAGPSLTTSSSSSGPGASRGSFYWAGRMDAGSGGANTFLSFGQFLNDRPGESMAGELFVGVTTQGCHGLVDTAAQEGLVGRPALLRLLDLLRPLGLKGCWTDKATQARGIGGAAKTVGVCEVPIGLGGVPGVLELTVVAEDVPLLLPVSLLRALGSVIDLSKDKITFSKVNGECNMTTLPSGHAAVDVLDFGPEGWVMPSACAGRRMESDFRTGQVFGSRPKTTRSPKTLKSEAYASFASPAAAAGAAAESMAASAESRQPAKARRPKLAGFVGQTLLAAGLGILANRGVTVALSSRARVAAAAQPYGYHFASDLDYKFGYQQGPDLQELPGRREARTVGFGERRADSRDWPLCSPSSAAQRRRQWTHELVPLQPVQGSMETQPTSGDREPVEGEDPQPGGERSETTREANGPEAPGGDGKPDAAAGGRARQERRAADYAGLARGRVPGVREGGGERDRNGGSPVRDGPDYREPGAGNGLRVQESSALRAGDPTSSEHAALARNQERLGASRGHDEASGGHGEPVLRAHDDPTNPSGAAAGRNVNVGQNIRSWDGTRVLQSATPNMVRRWMAKPLPFLDDFVVVSKNGVLQRMDRQDVEGLHSLEDEEVYVVVKEPELYLEHQSDETKIDKAKSDQILDYLVGASAGVDAMTIDLKGVNQNAVWKDIESQGPKVIYLNKVASEQSSLACRIARHQWRKGRGFVISALGPLSSGLKNLKEATSEGTASYLLYRKKYQITNFKDAVKYAMAKGKPPRAEGAIMDYNLECFPGEVAEQDIFDELDLRPMDTVDERPEDSVVPVGEPTRQEKEAVMKLHRNLGHPSLADLVRTLKVSRTPDRIWRWAKDSFRCPTCAASRTPKAHRPAMVPRSYAPNTVVAIDLLQMPNWDASGQNWYLNMICLGTSFQMVEKLRSKEPVSVWAAFTRTWGRFLGMPQILLLDQGREFLGEFRDRCAELGVLLHVIGARAPHQNGRCERHGGLFKQMMEKAKWQNPPCSEDDLRLLTREVEAAKNRLFNRSGFSPAQRMLGQTARTNGELMSDDAIDPALVNHGEEVERVLAARRAAQKAFVETNLSEAAKHALRARNRVH